MKCIYQPNMHSVKFSKIFENRTPNWREAFIKRNNLLSLRGLPPLPLESIIHEKMYGLELFEKLEVPNIELSCNQKPGYTLRELALQKDRPGNLVTHKESLSFLYV